MIRDNRYDFGWEAPDPWVDVVLRRDAEKRAYAVLVVPW